MAFKMVRNQQQDAAAIAASARTLARQVQDQIAARAAPFLRDGEQLPDLVFLQELLSRWLDSEGSRLLDQDDRYTGELHRVREVRARLKVGSDQLRGRLRDVRFLLERSLGRQAVAVRFGKPVLSEASPLALIQVGRQVRDVLRDPQYAWDQQAAGGLVANAAALAEALDHDVEVVVSHLAELKPRQRSKQVGLGDKVAELEAATSSTKRSADLLYGLYRVAGLDFHAQRLRPTRRVRGQGEEKAKGDAVKKPAKTGGEVDATQPDPVATSPPPTPLSKADPVL